MGSLDRSSKTLWMAGLPAIAPLAGNLRRILEGGVAHELCTGLRFGRVACGRGTLHATGCSVHRLDGDEVLGGPFLGADVGAIA